MIKLTKNTKWIIGGISAAILIGSIGIIAAVKHSFNDAGDMEVYTTQVSMLTSSSIGLVDRFAGVVEPQETLKIQ